MTIFNDALDHLRQLKEEPWKHISVPNALQHLGNINLQANDLFRGITGRDDWELKPSKPVGACYEDIVKDDYERQALAFAHKSTYVGPLDTATRRLVLHFGEEGIPHDPKKLFHTALISVDGKSASVTAISQEAASAAIESQIRLVQWAQQNMQKGWRVVQDGAERYYERSLRDDPDFILKSTLCDAIEQPRQKSPVIDGYYDADGQFFHQEKVTMPPIKLDQTFLDPELRRENARQELREKGKHKDSEPDALADCTPAVRIPATPEVTALLAQKLGIDFSQERRK